MRKNKRPVKANLETEITIAVFGERLNATHEGVQRIEKDIKGIYKNMKQINGTISETRAKVAANEAKIEQNDKWRFSFGVGLTVALVSGFFSLMLILIT